jgi:hypothetical protein
VNNKITESNRNIDWEYSSKPVSSWGGMRIMKEMLDKAGIREMLMELPLPAPGSNRGYDPIDTIESFWVSVWLGGAKFAHTAYVRFDEVLREIFNWKRVPSVSTYTRFFRKFNLELSDKIFPAFNRKFFSKIAVSKFTLDLDSTVITRYGEQEGSLRGYNPKKRGRASHHPLIAFVADIRMVLNAWMRPGNCSASNNVYNFFRETLRIIDADRIGLVRADSGFFAGKFMKYLESLYLNYIISVKTNPFLKNEIYRITNWLQVDGGIHISEFYYQAKRWDRARRIIVVRQSVIKKPKAMGKMLFPKLPEYCVYRYQVYATNMDLAGVDVWRLYSGRADAENRIQELKYDFGLEGFCLKDFYATEAAFRMVMIAYNLVSLFRQTVLNDEIQAKLSTIRFKCFAIGSWITKGGRKKVLKLSVVPRRRPWLDGLFSRAQGLSPPMLAKFHEI